jgi:aspartate/methionine/tyrosine aminotransferase
MVKLKSICLSSNTMGMLACELMCNPLQSESNLKQLKELFESQKVRAKIVQEKLDSMVNVKCQPLDGSMYAFAKIEFS